MRVVAEIVTISLALMALGALIVSHIIRLGGL